MEGQGTPESFRALAWIPRLRFESGTIYLSISCLNLSTFSDCAPYFLSNVKRLSDPAYVPSTQDILHTRVRTCGVVEVWQALTNRDKLWTSCLWSWLQVKFLIKDMMFRFNDVGGQRSDRRKWLSLFDCVHAVIFCVEASCPDNLSELV